MATKRDRVIPRMIEDEMKQSFLDYSMSVIVQRALPDVRDGLKPVHRRILFAMHEAGLSPMRPFKKSATVVGDVLGKYHPHGDASVYDAMVRMVQDCSLRYPLVAGQGNFGSIDGDRAAAYRYTEARLAPMATEILADIDKDTVDFTPNYDDRLQEPSVLPAMLPNLLINGSSGIAVGMSTNIPPHNLGEVIRAALHLLEDPECTIADLMKFIPGPDFPTGGIIIGKEGIRKAYETGRGRVVMQARIGRETKRGGREQLVVTEIPYATSKTRIIEQIADLTKRGKITDIADLRDESDRDGIRIVVELKRGVEVNKVLVPLYKWTALQSTFGVITLALDSGIPHEFSLKDLLERFRDHRVEVVVRRSRWELEKANDEAHVLEGLLIALANIDRVVKIIRSSRTREKAGEKLRKEFDLTERQADAILQMRLYRLTQLGTKELRDRLEALAKRIRALETLLKSPKRQLAEIRHELEQMLERYGDKRRTQIVDAAKGQTLENLVSHEDVVVTVTREGYIKQTAMSLYRRRVNAGKTLAGTERYETDYLEHVFVASTADTLMFFSDDGQAYWLPVDEIPEAGRSSRGRSLHQLLGVQSGTHFVSLLSTARQPNDAMLVFFTRGGTVKRTAFDQSGNPRAGGVNAINLRKGDSLLDVQISNGNADLVMVSQSGRAIRFAETDASVMGRAAQGVRGIKLSKGDCVVGAVVARRESAICLVTEKGFAARVSLSEFSVQKRDGLGVVAMKIDKKSGKVAAATEVVADDVLMLVISSGETHRLVVRDVPAISRGDEGEVAQKVKRGETVVEVTRTAAGRKGGEDSMADSGDTDSENDGDEEEPGTGEGEGEGKGKGKDGGQDEGSQFELLGEKN